ncbi:MAG: GntR family transcriptional regulator [Opitutaceae bacterium]|nr:GntR family transcriptional regulator [Opitutaceae bacterium]
MASHFLHESLTRSLLREMASGAFREGQRFYSLRKIGRQWKISEPTVTGSLRWLTDKGLLRTSARRGCFLTTGFQQKAQLLLLEGVFP